MKLHMKLTKWMVGSRKGAVLIYSFAISAIILFFSAAVIYNSSLSNSKIKVQAITDEAARYGAYLTYKNLCRFKKMNDIQKALLIAHLTTHGVCLCSSTCNSIPFVGPIIAGIACAVCVVVDPLIAISGSMLSIIMDIYPAVAGYQAYSDVAEFVSRALEPAEGSGQLKILVARWGQKIKIGRPLEGLNWHNYNGDGVFPLPYPFPSGAISGDNGIIKSKLAIVPNCTGGTTPCKQWLSVLQAPSVHRFLKYDTEFYSDQRGMKTTLVIEMKPNLHIAEGILNFMNLFVDTSPVRLPNIISVSQAESSPAINSRIHQKAEEVEGFLSLLADQGTPVKGVIDDGDVCSTSLKDIANTQFYIELEDLPLLPLFFADDESTRSEINNTLKKVNDSILH